MRLPADFILRTTALLGDEFNELATALQEPAPVSIRLNNRKQTQIPEGTPVPWSNQGYYLPERLTFTFDPLFHAGSYYVQETSSMFLEQAIRQYVTRPAICLDLCAAPGGKSTHLYDLLPEGSLLVSNEVIRSRSNILAENMAKWGASHIVVTNNDPEQLGQLTNLFDVIVTDVPCSGEGMFRKDAASMDEWSTDNVRLCAARQRRIIHSVWDALKPGGLLVYSTCTYNTEENEENIHYFTTELGAEVLPVDTVPAWNITGPLRYDHPVYRFFPHKTKGEGFFLALLRKPGNYTGSTSLKGKNKKNKKEKKGLIPSLPIDLLTGWLQAPDQFVIESIHTTIHAFPQAYTEVYQLLQQELHILLAGVKLGEIKGKDIIPAHHLAMSSSFNRNGFPVVAVSWEEAIRFLKKEAILLPATAPRGYVLLTYQDMPLGFVKNLGNRSNNLYPAEWRIRTGYLPDVIKCL
ncbi:MAG: RsmB/NOP family class I SAM-dependent RNA methyltransferase [Tannerellaceae bacterium]|nr:RsmB/NOP family class I SAM-dependent RNA methyltransferase [Tannerellaceae bacterium]